MLSNAVRRLVSAMTNCCCRTSTCSVNVVVERYVRIARIAFISNTRRNYLVKTGKSSVFERTDQYSLLGNRTRITVIEYGSLIKMSRGPSSSNKFGQIAEHPLVMTSLVSKHNTVLLEFTKNKLAQYSTCKC